MHRVIIDTGAIYAFIVRTDIHHMEARAFVSAMLAQKGTFVLADWVFAETMTLLKARVGVDVAIRVGTELRRNPLYTWAPLGIDHEQNAWAVFRKYADKEWSYTDCRIYVLSQQLKIAEIFGYDRHFDQMPGLSRVG